MGQANESPAEENGCFSPCVRRKRTANSPVLPKPIHQSHNKQLPYQVNSQDPPVKRPTLKKSITAPEVLETSLELRLQEEVSPEAVRKEIKNTAVLQRISPKAQETHPTPVPSPTPSYHKHQIDSKLLSSKQGFGSTKTTNFTRGSAVEAATVRVSSTEKEKELISETTSNSKSLENAKNKRKLIKNRIEEVKQKYFERQLQIEIYQDEESYQARVEKREKENKTSFLQKKHDRVEEGALDYSKVQHDVSISLSGQDALQLFSRQEPKRDEKGRVSFCSRRKDRKDRSSANRSINMEQSHSLNMSGNTSMESGDPMSFSQISNVSLQEIREVDEEEEDYISKITKINGGGTRIQSPDIISKQDYGSNAPKYVIRKEVGKDNSRIDSQPSQQESEEGARAVRVGEGGSGKDHKILLF